MAEMDIARLSSILATFDHRYSSTVERAMTALRAGKVTISGGYSAIPVAWLHRLYRIRANRADRPLSESEHEVQRWTCAREAAKQLAAAAEGALDERWWNYSLRAENADFAIWVDEQRAHGRFIAEYPRATAPTLDRPLDLGQQKGSVTNAEIEACMPPGEDHKDAQRLLRILSTMDPRYAAEVEDVRRALSDDLGYLIGGVQPVPVAEIHRRNKERASSSEPPPSEDPEDARMRADELEVARRLAAVTANALDESWLIYIVVCGVQNFSIYVDREERGRFIAPYKRLPSLPGHRALLALGKQQGFVTHDDIERHLPDGELTEEVIEPALRMLYRNGIPVVEGSGNRPEDR